MNVAEIKKKIVSTCPYCGGTGYCNNEVCTCMLVFRAYQCLLGGSFNLRLLDFVSSGEYEYPEFVFGGEYVLWYLNNFATVDSGGLSLFIYSRERGRGKTTLAHFLMYQYAYFFNKTENYSRRRKFGFTTVEDLLEKNKEYAEYKYLVLDDLGQEDLSSDWKRERKKNELQKLFQKRRANNLCTIITSNYTPIDLGNLYSGSLESLLEIRPDGNIGGELFRSLELGGGEDLRLLGGNSSWPI